MVVLPPPFSPMHGVVFSLSQGPFKKRNIVFCLKIKYAEMRPQRFGNLVQEAFGKAR